MQTGEESKARKLHILGKISVQSSITQLLGL